MSQAADIFCEPLDWLFWPALRPRQRAAWLGHVPFAHWIVGAHKPRVLVELGTHLGTSYGAFGDSIVRNSLPAKAYAIDTWAGDVHMGKFGETVFSDFKDFHDAHFAGFSTMIRATFDDARDQFADGSVDLLHIDGTHTYKAVRHDFENWAPKLSDRSIVLFHDTNERREGFGVWKLWGELCPYYASFEFLHSHGLGVLRYGAEVPAAAEQLFALEGEEQIRIVQQRFEALGNAVTISAQSEKAG